MSTEQVIVTAAQSQTLWTRNEKEFEVGPCQNTHAYPDVQSHPLPLRSVVYILMGPRVIDKTQKPFSFSFMQGVISRKLEGGSHIVAQRVKPPPATLASHIGVLLWILAPLLPIQLPDIVAGKAAEDGPHSWDPSPTSQTWMKLLVPGSGLGPALAVTAT